jgi:hypothetical protein
MPPTPKKGRDVQHVTAVAGKNEHGNRAADKFVKNALS